MNCSIQGFRHFVILHQKNPTKSLVSQNMKLKLRIRTQVGSQSQTKHYLPFHSRQEWCFRCKFLCLSGTSFRLSLHYTNACLLTICVYCLIPKRYYVDGALTKPNPLSLFWGEFVKQRTKWLVANMLTVIDLTFRPQDKQLPPRPDLLSVKNNCYWFLPQEL